MELKENIDTGITDVTLKAIISHQQMILKANTIMLALKFLKLSKPNYASIPFKPNKCIL